LLWYGYAFFPQVWEPVVFFSIHEQCTCTDLGKLLVGQMDLKRKLAKAGFFIIATQNPVEFIATTPLGEAIKDRFVWIRLEYQSEDEEKQIVAAKIKDAEKDIIDYSVSIVRETRLSTKLRRGASIRGAIDLASIINEFEERNLKTWIDISIMALATKIELEDGVEEKIETVIEELVRKVIGKFFRA